MSVGVWRISVYYNLWFSRERKMIIASRCYKWTLSFEEFVLEIQLAGDDDIHS